MNYNVRLLKNIVSEYNGGNTRQRPEKGGMAEFVV